MNEIAETKHIEEKESTSLEVFGVRVEENILEKEIV